VLIISFVCLAETDYPIKNELLLCFLRARKYDVNRADRALKNYLKMCDQYPDLTTNLQLQELQAHFNQRMQVITNNRDHLGRRIFIFRAGQWNPKISTSDDVFRCNVFCLQRLASDSETQIKGIVSIVDLKNLGIHHVRHVTPSYAKKIASLIQDCFPLRFQAIHLINEPWIFNIILSIILPLLSEKIQKRIHHHGNCWTSLHAHVDAAVLPEEYGGLLGPLDQSNWTDQVIGETAELFDFNNNK